MPIKPTEIEQGVRYYGANGKIREVVGFSDSQRRKGGADTVLYRRVPGPTTGNPRTCLAASFARWVEGRAPDAESEGQAA